MKFHAFSSIQRRRSFFIILFGFLSLNPQDSFQKAYGFDDALPNAAAGSVVITSPASNALINGPVNFSVSVQVSGVASVEYLLDGKRLSGPVTSPFVYSWHAAYAWNGVYTLQAVALDGTGSELARSSPVSFTVSNRPGSVILTSSNVTGQTISGKITISATMNPAPGRQLERMIVSVDGYQQPPYFSYPISYTLDTTTLENGPHEIVITAFDSIAGQDGVGMVQLPVNVQNGHVLQQIRTNWSQVFLKPGESTQIGVLLMYTDGQEQAYTGVVSSSSDNVAVASISPAGVVSAVAPGMANLTVQAMSRSTTVRVLVDPTHVAAHFSKNGGILTVYDPARSLFLRTLFFLDSTALQTTAGLAGAVQKGAVNALTSGLYLNPADGYQAPNFDAWKHQWDPMWTGIVNTAAASNLSLFFYGDDIARSSAEMANSLAGSYSTQAIQYALTKARDCGRGVSIDMVDEVDFGWGSTPKPTDGRWLRYNPAIPNSAFSTLMNVVNGVSGRLPISWPVSGLADGITAGNWMGNPALSDYSSDYSTYVDNRFVYPWGPSLNQDRSNLDRTLFARMPYLQHGKPVIMNVGLTGDGYTKNGPGSSFVPGQDTLDVPGMTPVRVAAQVLYAAARNMAGVRAYGYDGAGWKYQRSYSATGTSGLQQGTDPFGLGQDRWRAMSAAFNLVQKLEPDLLQPPVSAIDLGADFVTGAKQGPNSRVLVAINYSETSHTETVNLAPYQYGGATGIERYRLLGEFMQPDTIANTSSVQQQFEPGQVVVWVFRPGALVAPPSPPTSPAGGSTPAPVSPAPISAAPVVKPFAYWKLNEGSSVLGYDSSGNGYVAVLSNNPSWLSGTSCVTSACLNFNGQNQYGKVTLNLAKTKAITVAFWMNWSQYSGNDALAFEFGSGLFGFNSSTTGFMIDPNSSQNGGGQFEAGLKGNAGYNQILFQRPAAGSWHHFAVVFDKSQAAANQVTPFVDGVAVPYTKISSTANTNNFGNNPLYFMSRLGSALFGKGSLAEVQVFDRALSPAQIGALFQHVAGR